MCSGRCSGRCSGICSSMCSSIYSSMYSALPDYTAVHQYPASAAIYTQPCGHTLAWPGTWVRQGRGGRCGRPVLRLALRTREHHCARGEFQITMHEHTGGCGGEQGVCALGALPTRTYPLTPTPQDGWNTTPLRAYEASMYCCLLVQRYYAVNCTQDRRNYSRPTRLEYGTAPTLH